MLPRFFIVTALIGAAGYAATANAPAIAPQDGGKQSDVPGGRYDVDPVHSSVLFKIKHVGVSNFYGRFNKVSGKLVLDAEDPAESMISLSIDAKSIDTNDAKRDAHLRGPDFFNVEEKGFDTLTFESEKVTPKSATEFDVLGKFKLHGVGRTITVAATQVGAGATPMGTRVGYECRFTIKRTDYKMNYDTNALGDEVVIVVSVEAVRK